MFKVIIILFILCFIGFLFLLLSDIGKEKDIIKTNADKYTEEEIVRKIKDLEDFLDRTNIKGELLENTLDKISFWQRTLEQKIKEYD